MARLEVRYETGGETLIVGQLLSVARTIYFQYDAAFRTRGFELSPFRLPVSMEEPVEERERTYHGLHGLFNDSLPDGWGMRIMDRAFRQRGVDPAALTPLDRLAFLGDRTMGALTYHPCSEPDEPALKLDLTAIAAQSQRILEGSAEKVLPAIVRAGGSPMGARPKIVAGVSEDFTHLVTGTPAIPLGYSHWLIKFSAEVDRPDAGAIEMAYAAMARAAGITFPRTHQFTTRDGRGHFGVERFDRDPRVPSRRIHTHTFAGLLHHDHRVPGQDYHDLLKVTRVLTRNHRDVAEAFRRMVFNVLAHNRDDHTKNFAFQMSSTGEWRLAPAYDVTFSHGPGGEHTLLVAGEGRAPTGASIEAVATRASLEPREVRETIERVQGAVATWSTVAKECGVSAGSRREIARSLAGKGRQP